MALGGGTFTSMNKKLPGTYINFIQAGGTSGGLGERGYVAFGLKMDWGPDGEVFTVTKEDFLKNTRKIFGYEYDAPQMKPLRDLFMHAHTLYAYKLNSATTGKATCTYADANHAGTCGNKLTIRIAVNVDDEDKYDVETLYNGIVMDKQTVETAAELKANDWVTFKSGASLTTTAGTNLTGGVSAAVTAANHQTMLDLLETYHFNALGCANDESEDDALALNALYAAYCRRMRDEVGNKFQVVLYQHAADYEGCVNVQNAVTADNAAELVYWVTGVIAGTAVNASCTNMAYDGEYTVNVNYTQAQLEGFIDGGRFAMHRVGQQIRVLEDLNSMVTTTADKGDMFKENQTIRVIDEIATQVADIFNTKYLGRIPNDASGRTSLWSDVVAIHRQLNTIRAIENFDEKHITVEQGQTKKAVVINSLVTVVNAMTQLYMTCVIQ